TEGAHDGAHSAGRVERVRQVGGDGEPGPGRVVQADEGAGGGAGAEGGHPVDQVGDRVSLVEVQPLQVYGAGGGDAAAGAGGRVGVPPQVPGAALRGAPPALHDEGQHVGGEVVVTRRVGGADGAGVRRDLVGRHGSPLASGGEIMR